MQIEGHSQVSEKKELYSNYLMMTRDLWICKNLENASDKERFPTTNECEQRTQDKSIWRREENSNVK